MRAIDLFAGAGGFSTGAAMAGCQVVWAGNHWQAAVDAHAINHPGTLHACQDLQQQDWTQVPQHDLLLASPACQGHSPARGKEKAHHDALRSTAWAVVSAAECHRPAVFVVENVPAFAAWTLYPAWCAAMNALGYALAPMVLDAADHGVPQHRLRLFIVGTRSAHPITLDLPRAAMATAADVIDFSAGRWSAIDKPGRSCNTLARIAAGRLRHGHRFVAPYYGSGSGETGRSLHRPLGTITTRDRWSVIDGDRMRMLTAEECRAAMGFPAGYHLPADHKTAVHMLGNAVCPPQARDLIHALRAAA
ncbi:DNA cytosine methyltransferase [Acidovorax sp. A1169]|uniref:DNA cytosine methyltransferase n=1 Tax=Acidovorax sp. A1169 TaxID=3059524 RepID=UPI002737D239|nr:DNA cytosine methyltransferase [Acidovorax sp. A1169]MDP4074235.1 DNA cytosine methyltransferase [Acidovorax sp. A1169]